MKPSAVILNTLNTLNGKQHRDYLKLFKGIFIQCSLAISTLVSATAGGIIANQSNALSNDELSFQDEVAPILIGIGKNLVTAGAATQGNAIIAAVNLLPKSNQVWLDQMLPIFQNIQSGLAALGQ